MIMRCLLVEDDAELAGWLVRSLAEAGIVTDWADSGTIAAARILEERYDVVLLDLGLPDLGGAAVLARVRQAGAAVPILILTARDDLAERVQLLHEGADDFLTKPFALAELVARLTALLRRSLGRASGQFTCGTLGYDAPRRRFTLAGAPLDLAPREHAILELLIQRPGEPQSKAHLLDRLVGEEVEIQIEAVEVMIYRLRRRLEGSDVRVVTQRGLGYFLEPVDGG
ncbi:response regulator [Frigidibacter sp. MR17.14]|uniref:response regulator n=1 Tax=Frigidibacter sp. MR17.14 TaxID=3126509 RepID=UPI003012B7C6